MAVRCASFRPRARRCPARGGGAARVLAGLLFLAALAPGAGRAQFEPAQFEPIVPGPVQPVSLELVLAVDTSSSVSPEEFDLQMHGFSGAFRDPSVIAAILATGTSGIAVSMIQWSDNRRQQLAVDWALLTDEASILAFAEAIDDTPRFLDGGGTAISGAIEFGLAELSRNAFAGTRQVIDISGDGRANQGASPDSLRDLAILQGVTVNGLAILNEDTSVADYYKTNVIGGEGAFVMTANDYESFALAIQEKLIKEIGGVPVAEGPGAPGAPGGRTVAAGAELAQMPEAAAERTALGGPRPPRRGVVPE
ncbi:DUF1194 domain-containing protein [Pelagibius sp. 7325]|uniref:DUF1194 domain-containing protein n=1 Tax=Pelagibius sp. 7325 TaxID=3131994 RepID=UPI0030EDEC3A